MAEKELSRRARIVLAAALWIIVGPLVIGLFMIAWPVGLLALLAAAWTTYDYIRSGGMADHVSEGMSKSGLVGKGAEELFGREIDD